MANQNDIQLMAQEILNKKNKKSNFDVVYTDPNIEKEYRYEDEYMGDGLVESIENTIEGERLKKEKLDAIKWAQEMNENRNKMKDKPYISPEYYNAMKYEIFKRNILKNKRIIDPKTIDDLIRQNMNQ